MCRGLFIISPKGILRQMTINDLPVGRSVDETLRLVKAFQACHAAHSSRSFAFFFLMQFAAHRVRSANSIATCPFYNSKDYILSIGCAIDSMQFLGYTKLIWP